MTGVRQYVISLVTAALICGILSGFFENGATKQLIKLLCALFLTFTAISPVTDIDLAGLTEYMQSYSAQAENTAAMGERMAEEAMTDIIKTKAESYILDKAADLQAEITAEVFVDDHNIPTEAKLSGEISPYAKERLKEILESDLGITKENQIWIG